MEKGNLFLTIEQSVKYQKIAKTFIQAFSMYSYLGFG